MNIYIKADLIRQTNCKQGFIDMEKEQAVNGSRLAPMEQSSPPLAKH